MKKETLRRNSLFKVKQIFIPAAFLTLLAACNISAQVFGGTGLPVVAPDATAGGCGNAIASPNTTTTCVTVPVSGIFAGSTLSNLTVGFTVGTDPGTFIGDYGITLRAPGGSPSMLLMGQPGNATPFAGGCGDSTNLNSGTSVTFSDSPSGAANSLPGVIAGLSSTQTLPSGTYNPSLGNTSPSGSIMATFGGMPGAAQNGNWQLCFHDVSQTDTMSISAVSLSLNQAPSAASGYIKGVVKNSYGRRLSGASVYLTNTQTGELYFRRSNQLGHFSITDLPIGDFYILSIQSKKYEFNTLSFTLNDNLEDLEITGF